jgi:plastocyanin
MSHEAARGRGGLERTIMRGRAILSIAIGAIGAVATIGAVAAVAAVAAAAVAAAPESTPPAGGGSLRGQVVLLAKGGKEPARGSDARQAIVFFEPAAPARLRPPEKPYEMTTRKKEFVPRILAVVRGSRVQFPNEDPILHNVFSVSAGNAFDFGFYRDGAHREKRFDQPGLVRVYCNVHQAMAGYVLVLDTPYFTAPAADGSFSLAGLPPGPGKLSVWHEQADAWTSNVTVPAAAPVAARLEIVRPLVVPHLNKSGESYFRSNRDRYDDR